MPEATEVKAEPSTGLSDDDLRVWNELWTSVHNDHYACFYEEAVAEFLVARWRLVDTVTKFSTTLTASGSTIAAWVIWKGATGQGIWVVLAGTAAIMALIHQTLGISDRIKEDTLIYSTFQQLRLDLETLKKKMRLKLHDSLTAYLSDYMDITGKFGKAHALKRPDFFLTLGREKKIQADINTRLGLT
jgi:hypothetical protein